MPEQGKCVIIVFYRVLHIRNRYPVFLVIDDLMEKNPPSAGDDPAQIELIYRSGPDIKER